MIKILKKDNDTIQIFTGNTTNYNIYKWVYGKSEEEGNPFNLNESYSCVVSFPNCEDRVLIVGDEDYVELNIEEYEPLDLQEKDPEVEKTFKDIQRALIDLEPGGKIHFEFRKKLVEDADKSISITLDNSHRTTHHMYLDSADHIGQVRIEDADNEIKRLESGGFSKWRKDFTPFLSDNSDNETITLNEGYCWIIRTNS